MINVTTKPVDVAEAVQRMQFEKWYRREYWDFKYGGLDMAPYDHEAGRYSHMDVNLAWNAWKEASRTSNLETNWLPSCDAPYDVDLLVFGPNGYIRQDYRSKQYETRWTHWMRLPPSPAVQG